MFRVTVRAGNFASSFQKSFQRVILWDAEKIVLVEFTQGKGYPVYVLLDYVVAEAVIANMGGDKLPQLRIAYAGVMLFDNSRAHSVHYGVCTLYLIDRCSIHIDFKVSHKPGKIRVHRQFAQSA